MNLKRRDWTVTYFKIVAKTLVKSEFDFEMAMQPVFT